MIDLKIGGVPEHFNYPWYLTLKKKLFQPLNVHLRWMDFPGGTGDMCRALRLKEIDIAIVLTEGIVRDINNGNPSKILQTYVETPLNWGVHVAADSNLNTMADLENKRIAISRFGSGSHLMAIVNAHYQGWAMDDLDFVVVENLKGGIHAVQNNTADYFLWEHFTTKPYVDQEIFKRIDNCPSPWPCFVIAVRDEILEKYPNEIRDVLEVINQQNSNFKQIKNIDTILSHHYGQRLEDIQKWLSMTSWNTGTPVDSKFICEIQHQHLVYGLISEKKSPEVYIKNMYL